MTFDKFNSFDIEVGVDKDQEERIIKFNNSQRVRLTVSEWKVLLAFAYNGPSSMYFIGKNYDMRYAAVLRATRKLEKMGWIKLLKEGKSQKNVTVKTYGLTLEGLLWFFSRIPKSVYPGLIEEFVDDFGRKLRERLENEDLNLISKLRTNDDIYLHLLFYLDIDKIAEKNGHLWPQVFGNWKKLKDLKIDGDIKWLLPETAFSSLLEYYHKYDLHLKYESLGKILTYKVVEGLIDMYMRSYAHTHIDKFKNEILDKMFKVIESVPDIRMFIADIVEKTEKDHLRELGFIRKLKSAINKNDYRRKPNIENDT